MSQIMYANAFDARFLRPSCHLTVQIGFGYREKPFVSPDRIPVQNRISKASFETGLSETKGRNFLNSSTVQNNMDSAFFLPMLPHTLAGLV